MTLKGHNPFRKINSGKTQTPSPQFGLDPAKEGVKAAPIARTASKKDEVVYGEDGQYNPRPLAGYDDRDGTRRAIAAKTGRLFDKSGELNAWDKRDAMQQVAYLMGHVAPNAPARKNASVLENDEKRRVIAAAAKDPTGEGFAILGQELLLPIKDIVDYEGWCRKLYRVRPLAQGELFRIARDVRATAWIIGQDGQALESRVTGKYILPSEFKIGSFVTVDLMELYQANYDILDRAQDTARQEIELEEDKRGLALLDTAARSVNTVTTFGTLGVAALEAARVQIERHRLVATRFMVNRQDASDVFTTMSSGVDPVTQRELLLAGYWGNFFGCMVITAAGTQVEEVVPQNTFYCATDPEYLGEMGIRVELFSEPFNKYANKEFVKGWGFCEIVGFAIPNARACSVATRA